MSSAMLTCLYTYCIKLVGAWPLTVTQLNIGRSPSAAGTVDILTATGASCQNTIASCRRFLHKQNLCTFRAGWWEPLCWCSYWSLNLIPDCNTAEQWPQPIYCNDCSGILTAPGGNCQNTIASCRRFHLVYHLLCIGKSIDLISSVPWAEQKKTLHTWSASNPAVDANFGLSLNRKLGRREDEGIAKGCTVISVKCNLSMHLSQNKYIGRLSRKYPAV